MRLSCSAVPLLCANCTAKSVTTRSGSNGPRFNRARCASMNPPNSPSATARERSRKLSTSAANCEKPFVIGFGTPLEVRSCSLSCSRSSLSFKPTADAKEDPKACMCRRSTSCRPSVAPRNADIGNAISNMRLPTPLTAMLLNLRNTGCENITSTNASLAWNRSSSKLANCLIKSLEVPVPVRQLVPFSGSAASECNANINAVSKTA
mmetsp:Transcript_70802/g.188892  ORF Transcript_70802/g.188892 Transcript_70802/m.188892 type:complete len:207 (+) Transcript_70802:1252-1872(+)